MMVRSYRAVLSAIIGRRFGRANKLGKKVAAWDDGGLMMQETRKEPGVLMHRMLQCRVSCP